MRLLFIQFCFLVFVHETQALTTLAEVVIVKGSATQLAPREKTAKALMVGDKLLEDTSILTGDRSFVRLKLIDGSTMNIGSNTKVALEEMAKNGTSLVSLLKGKLRTQVEKDANLNSENKFFLKTRTAAMGVRGTDFQAVYNPDNKVTSLVTLEGEVAMAKIDQSTHEELDQISNKTNLEINRSADGKTPEVKLQKQDSVAQMQKLDKILAKNDVVVVEAGQYSGSSEELKKSTVPVKISPVQFEVLLKNRELNEKRAENLKGQALENAKRDMSKLMVDSKADPNGFFDPRTGEFAPKAGGVVDLETGLYVAPGTDARFDERNRVYVSNKIGAIDNETGQYIPPAGLKLDSMKGFVEVEKTNDPSLLSLKEDLNKTSIQKDVVIGNPEDKIFKIENKFLKDELAFSIFSGSVAKTINPDNAASFEKESSSYIEYRAKWSMSSAMKFRPTLELRFKKLEFENDSRFTHGDETAIDLLAGVHYALSKRSNLLLHFGIRQDVYMAKTETANLYQLTRMGVTELGFGYQYDYDFSDRFLLKSNLLPYFAFSRDVGSVGVGKTVGLKLEVMPTYKLKSQNSVGLGFSLDSSKREVTTLSNGKTDDDTSVAGLFLQYQISY